MKVAALSDIHGNIYALEAVLKDIASRGADMVFCGGDLVGYGAFPNEVISFLRQNHIPTIMGNYDEGIGHDSDDCGCAYRGELSKELGKRSIAWTRKKVTPDNKIYLCGLLQRINFEVYGKKVLLVHGSPRKINEYLFEDRPEASVIRMFEAEKVDVIICGHTHLPYIKDMIVEEGWDTAKESDGRETIGKKPGGRYILINTGSVGKPEDGDPRAGYGLIDFGDGGITYEIIRVPYDVEAMARAVEQSGLPVEYADMLRHGSG
jgi:putative phosphoesterase